MFHPPARTSSWPQCGPQSLSPAPSCPQAPHLPVPHLRVPPLQAPSQPSITPAMLLAPTLPSMFPPNHPLPSVPTGCSEQEAGFSPSPRLSHPLLSSDPVLPRAPIFKGYFRPAPGCGLPPGGLQAQPQEGLGRWAQPHLFSPRPLCPSPGQAAHTLFNPVMGSSARSVNG